MSHISNASSTCALGWQSKVAASVEAPNEWSPYIDNKGTVVAVAGEDFVVVGGDTRLSYGFAIPTRSFSKYTKLTEKCVIITSGMQSDIVTLHRILRIYVAEYEYKNRKPPSLNALQQLLATVLYQKRFFPFYTFNILAGINSDGKAAVYSYDAIGSTKAEKYGASGTGGEFALSILDNQIHLGNQSIKKPLPSKLEVIDLVKDIFTVVAERDIHTGDAVDVIVIDSSGFNVSQTPLRGD